MTQAAVPSMRRFDKATLLVWGERATNFEGHGADKVIRHARRDAVQQADRTGD